jgi:mannosyltransferase OCH1-like enzyme
VSDKPFPEKFEPLLETWRRVMPDYEIVILALDNIPHNPWVDGAIAQGDYILAGHYARCQRIFETGGIYFDIDVEAVRPFDDLLDCAMFIGGESDEWVNNAVFGAEAGHPFLAECMAYMDTFPLDHPEAPNETGPRMFTRLIRARGWESGNETHMVGDIKVLAPEWFYPYLYTESFDPACITSETHAIHHWAYTWNPALEG